MKDDDDLRDLLVQKLRWLKLGTPTRLVGA